MLIGPLLRTRLCCVDTSCIRIAWWWTTRFLSSCTSPAVQQFQRHQGRVLLQCSNFPQGLKFFVECHTNGGCSSPDEIPGKAVFVNIQGGGISDEYGPDSELFRVWSEWFAKTYPQPSVFEISGSLSPATMATPLSPTTKISKGKGVTRISKGRQFGLVILLLIVLFLLLWCVWRYYRRSAKKDIASHQTRRWNVAGERGSWSSYGAVAGDKQIRMITSDSVLED